MKFSRGQVFVIVSTNHKNVNLLKLTTSSEGASIADRSMAFLRINSTEQLSIHSAGELHTFDVWKAWWSVYEYQVEVGISALYD